MPVVRDTALAMLTRAVAGLTAEVRCLHDENERLHEQMAAMAAQQDATSWLMTGLQPGEPQHHARWPPEQTSAQSSAISRVADGAGTFLGELLSDYSHGGTDRGHAGAALPARLPAAHRLCHTQLQVPSFSPLSLSLVCWPSTDR
jgi:hypothetical protein